MTKPKVIVLGASAIALGAFGWFLRPARAPAPAPAPTASAAAPSIPATVQDEPPVPRKRPSAPRSGGEFDNPDLIAWQWAIVEDLVRRDDAESLLVAALLSIRILSTSVDPAAGARYEVELLRRASKLAPGDPAVQWRAWSECRSLVESKLRCDAAPFEEALRTADPASAWPAVVALERAMKQKADVPAAVAAVAEHGRFDTYQAALFPAIFDGIESARVPPPVQRGPGYETAQAFALVVWASEPIGDLRPLLDACKVDAADSLAGRCREIASRMRRGDSYFARAVGLKIAEHVAPQGSADSNAIREEHRHLEWVIEQIRRHQPSLEAMRRLLPAAGGEVEFWESWLRENGLPLTPPADWVQP